MGAGRYTHRVGISNRRLVSLDQSGDRLLVTWRAPDGVRMRIAPAAEIAGAPDRLLAAVASEVELQTRHGVGLAFVAVERERSAVFRVDSSGEVRGLAAPAD